ncbi:MAG TPA: Holliday junction ATP-dependent DNA helicase RuvA [Leptospiraceae bacterium]|nr:Holliday junction ATP-dependent DNA helicase RuvA [Leptospiraceae bacterium]HMW04611.1 Holliday junction ATP-dependent DNA helicase RuvA [Leptospiraceae bacterium]HMY30448.1 Holliday junction ATP-dependent DNA helicase RuvA [Leptospiraceae bacterium]HMZ67051.1 Holliday junction ATP-dependent DNA helicase RuvA [Leptospiraceae bacterium]HNA06455.1 Holliday junction ATP-dependent DNA helicase RuvA [Leptospiraceae bacterium]
MISGLKGKLERLDVNLAEINVSGVIYEVNISFKSFEEIKTNLGKEVHLYIYHLINERTQKLFGFLNLRDKELFKLVRGLHGIGEMTALKILSFMSADELYRAVVNGDNSQLEKIPKVKGKTSEKIIFEVKQNLKKFEAFLNTEKENYIPTKEEKQDLSVLALIQLGFDEKTAIKEVAKVVSSRKIEDTAEIIREVLKLS